MRLPNVIAWLVAGLLLGAAPSAAQQRIVIQGLAGAEAWSTAGGSRLLARNADRPLVLGQLQLWGAASLGSNLLALIHVEGETGEGDEVVDLSQLVLRWSPSRAAMVEAGRFPSPVGAFAPRRLADANPLIGTPDLYPVSYPWGVVLSGVVGPLDYRAAVVDRPVTNEKYVPRGGSRGRLAIGAGVTPVIGARVGASFTAGAYLSRDVAGSLPPSSRWHEFGQRVLALDGALSRGYLEIRAEVALSSYDVPGRADPVSGKAVYLETKYTWSPRWFTAVRLERNKYAFIRPTTTGPWVGSPTTFVDGEIGVGYRIDHRSLVKISARADSWDVPPALQRFLPNGRALAFQVSRGFDLTAWLRD